MRNEELTLTGLGVIRDCPATRLWLSQASARRRVRIWGGDVSFSARTEMTHLQIPTFRTPI